MPLWGSHNISFWTWCTNVMMPHWAPTSSEQKGNPLTPSPRLPRPKPWLPEQVEPAQPAQPACRLPQLKMPQQFQTAAVWTYEINTYQHISTRWCKWCKCAKQDIDAIDAQFHWWQWLVQLWLLSSLVSWPPAQGGMDQRQPNPHIGEDWAFVVYLLDAKFQVASYGKIPDCAVQI